ncbi:protein-L-isoaspartate(D-aspartate) O-methyltransferase [Persicimonas caeni]|uniref:Protein-L-isoaspartate O-methyltransferase n=1 Tax=Persicimonas caeni TaxID=2292766 RepID=A0A4Y6Q0X3_PERCE|nr:protein-L-isoaspartate(D-aspartate) O-methyltransferase [Persicimonas caeni]QDG54238.1 protein-L-isoaspartate(D-aspartate) O-methyltransferase [Persicimonas caeni]QED35459.1 protein-L-isoaspartate(D-aspartate) O-methyltransferase [Persicimonas caeni]
MKSTDFSWKRERMVEEQIKRRGVEQKAVLEAMAEVPREEFVPDKYKTTAYSDRPLPIGEGQTISQPYMVAMMTESLQLGPEDKVLEIGAGSGYAAAILSRVAGEVYTVERHRSLAEQARERFEKLGYDNIHVRHADGTKGWAEEAPFDAIVAAAAGPTVPESLKHQLAQGGRLVIPVGQRMGAQTLMRVTRAQQNGDFKEENLGAVRFVPLIGSEGFEEPGGPSPGSRFLEG